MPDKTASVCFGLFYIGPAILEHSSKNLARTEKYFQYFFLFLLLTFKVVHSIFLLHGYADCLQNRQKDTRETLIDCSP